MQTGGDTDAGEAPARLPLEDLVHRPCREHPRRPAIELGAVHAREDPLAVLLRGRDPSKRDEVEEHPGLAAGLALRPALEEELAGEVTLEFVVPGGHELLQEHPRGGGEVVEGQVNVEDPAIVVEVACGDEAASASATAPGSSPWATAENTASSSERLATSGSVIRGI